MLSLLLALTVALAGLGTYLAVLLLPTLARRTDLPWSGAALFYALVLWFCSGQVRGALLLGQLAAIALILWLGVQVVQSRWALLSAEEQQAIRSGDLARQQWRTLQRQSPGDLLAGLRAGLGLPEKEAAAPGPNPLVAFWKGLQGRKSHGKEFLRETPVTEAVTEAPETEAPAPESEPVAEVMEAAVETEAILDAAEVPVAPVAEETVEPEAVTASESPETPAAVVESSPSPEPEGEATVSMTEAVVEAVAEESPAEAQTVETPGAEPSEAAVLEEVGAEIPAEPAEAIAAENWVDDEPLEVTEAVAAVAAVVAEAAEVGAEEELAEPTWVDEATVPEPEPAPEPAPEPETVEAEPPIESSTVVEVQDTVPEPEVEPQAIAEAAPASNEPIVISDLSELLEPTPELAAQLYRQPIPPEEQAAIDRDWEQEEFV